MIATTRQPDAGRLPSHSESASALKAFSGTQPPETALPAPDGPLGVATGRPGISRRHVLTAGAALAAVGGAAVPALAAAGDPVVDLCAEFFRLNERCEALYRPARSWSLDNRQESSSKSRVFPAY